MHRYYQLALQPNLFGGISLLRYWGRIGRNGSGRAELFDHFSEAETRMQALARQKTRRGYTPLPFSVDF